MEKLGKALLKLVNELITNCCFQITHKRRAADFTRNRKLGFVTIMLFLFNLVRKSLQVEVDDFYDAQDTPVHLRATMDAFIKARNKVLPSAFIEIFRKAADLCLQSDEFPTFNGYRVFAVDGSSLLFPANVDILQYLDPSPNDPKMAAARISSLCELHTGVVIDATIGSLKTSERQMAMDHIERFLLHKKDRDIILFDRGYPSKQLLAYLVDHHVFFLMRMPRSFHKSIDNAPLGESAYSFVHEGTAYTLRICKVTLPTGEIETLITNLPQSEFSCESLCILYNLRWGVETSYDRLKNTLQMEYFTCRKWEYILQDLYASLFVSNVAATLAQASNALIVQRERQLPIPPRHPHAVSKSVLIGKMKNYFFRAIAANNAATRAYFFNKLYKEASRFYDCVRPGRSFPRHPRKNSHHNSHPPRARAL